MSHYEGLLYNVPLGQGYFYLRDADNHSKMVRVVNVSIGDVFLVGGQSNSVPHFQNYFSKWTNLSYAPSISYGTSWSALISEKSSYPYLASRIIDSQEVPVGIIVTGVGGTTIDEWLPNGDLYGTMISKTEFATGKMDKVKAF